MSSTVPATPPPSGVKTTGLQADFDLTNTTAVATFGEAVQREVAGFADEILKQTRGGELGDTNALLSDLIAKAKGLDAASLHEGGALTRLVGGVRRRLLKFKARFETVSAEIETISRELDRRVSRMRRDIEVLDGLHRQTSRSITQLDCFIADGQAYAEQFRRERLPALAAAAAGGGDGQSRDLLAAQAFHDAVQGLDRLEKRVFVLQQARQIAIQQLPQIRIVQSGDATLAESLNASLTLTIPAWKQKMVVLLGLQRQKEALAMQRAVTDATNDMLRQASEMMKTQSLEVEEESQRGIVDIDVLAQTNQDLIDTINGVLQIQAEGRAKRAVAEQALQQQTGQLRSALAGTGRAAA